MAEPIRNIKEMEVSKEVIKEKNIAEVLEAVSDNKEAILKGIQLLSNLNESGGLDIANAFIIHRKVALEKLITELDKERYASSLENLTKTIFLLGTLNIDNLEHFINKVNNGMEEAILSEAEAHETSTTYMSLFKALKDPQVNRSITLLLEFLRGMGKEE